VFGADQALEDDAERAVRAGLAIVAEASPLAAGFSERYHLDGFALRVGIHTGPVLLGGGINAEGSIRGVTVNIAARMEQTAPAGALRISHETYRHVRGIFDVEAQAPIEIKGITVPVRSYLVHARQAAHLSHRQPRPRGDRDADGRARRRPCAHREAFLGACGDKSLRQVTIVGEPGIGKSRLGLEFTHWLELLREPVRFFQGRPSPTATTSRTACSATCSPGVSRSSRAIRSRSRRASSPPAWHRRSASARRSTPALIGELIGFEYHDDPHIAAIAGEAKQIRDRAFHALASYFRALQLESGTPVVLLLDDPHWADEGSLDFVNHLVQSCGDLPLFILGLTRSTLFERRPLWGSGRNEHLRIDLAPLSTRGTRELIEALRSRLETGALRRCAICSRAAPKATRTSSRS
jgi:hypothetical protein